MSATFFATAAHFRRWLLANHATAVELWVGFYKRGSGKGGLSYKEAVDELLCFGWIDGLLQPIDAESYSHRVTPRRRGSIWSLVNVKHVERLTQAGRMHPAGVRVFASRAQHKIGHYSYEKRESAPRPQEFPSAIARIFRANRPAWTHWQEQPPGYRRNLVHWVCSAKQPATRDRRLQKLIDASAAGRRLR